MKQAKSDMLMMMSEVKDLLMATSNKRQTLHTLVRFEQRWLK